MRAEFDQPSFGEAFLDYWNWLSNRVQLNLN